MKLKEAKKLYENEFTSFEVYKFTGKRHEIHTDFVRELQSYEYNDESDVVAHQLMTEDDYNLSILDNCGNEFCDVHEKNDKVLVIVIA